jgi:hypothetical protein
MVTNAMKHTLIISTTTCFVSGEGSRGVKRGQARTPRFTKRAKKRRATALVA